MGCTSSAPKMIASHANATETNTQFLEEIELINEPKRMKMVVNNDTQVLPLCDNNIEDKQLSSHKRPTSNKPTRKDSTVDQESQTCDDIESCGDSSSSKQTEEKLTSLNEVVEKVVELYVSNNSLNSIENLQKEMDETLRDEGQEEIVVVTENDKNDVHQNYQVENQLEELASPSQSESSRATRWEALADIAAELPPSLAVDPVTGQIYALSK